MVRLDLRWHVVDRRPCRRSFVTRCARYLSGVVTQKNRHTRTDTHRPVHAPTRVMSTRSSTRAQQQCPELKAIANGAHRASHNPPQGARCLGEGIRKYFVVEKRSAEKPPPHVHGGFAAAGKSVQSPVPQQAYSAAARGRGHNNTQDLSSTRATSTTSAFTPFDVCAAY